MFNSPAPSQELTVNPSMGVQAPLAVQSNEEAILWRNRSSGENAFWNFSDGKRTPNTSISTVADPAWQQRGYGDFNSDGTSDIVWRNADSGQLAIWYQAEDGSSLDRNFMNFNPGKNWDVAGVGDLNGDGFNDLFFQSAAIAGSKESAVWYMNGTQRYNPIATEFSLSFSGNELIEGLADFNGDSKADLLFKNQKTGLVSIQYMDGAEATGKTALSQYSADSAQLNWDIIGTGDFNSDGDADILWRNGNDGQIASWNLNGEGARIGSTELAKASDLGWTPIASYAPATQFEAVDMRPRQFLQVNASRELSEMIDTDDRNMVIDIASRLELAFAGTITPTTKVLEFNLTPETIAQFEDAFSYNSGMPSDIAA